MHLSRFALPRGAHLSLTLILGLALAACSGGSTDASDDTSGGGTIAVTNGVAELSADNLEFDASTITAPAGEPFTITFTNNEAAPHNVTVYVSEGGDQIGETGATIGEGETTDLAVEALEPGTYYFRCDIHPEMEGSIVVEG